MRILRSSKASLTRQTQTDVELPEGVLSEAPIGLPNEATPTHTRAATKKPEAYPQRSAISG